MAAHVVKTFGCDRAKTSQTRGAERRRCDVLPGDATGQHGCAMLALTAQEIAVMCMIDDHHGGHGA
ncbi:hypothetical protein CV770_11465 [Bradyrhizobium sp. AC87j1]|nr:hypothetical protein CV770_11465 [Bradyrhizobium sp. AC87j1]